MSSREITEERMANFHLRAKVTEDDPDKLLVALVKLEKQGVIQWDVEPDGQVGLYEMSDELTTLIAMVEWGQARIG